MEERVYEIKEAASSKINLCIAGLSSELLTQFEKILRDTFVLGALWADSHPYQDLIMKAKDVEDLNLYNNDKRTDI